MKNFIKFIFIVIISSITSQVFAHKDHADKPKMPAIGIVRGLVIDSTSSKPLEYASVSLVDLEHNEVITGGLTDRDGRLNIKEIPLGKYSAVIEFIGYKTKEIPLINIFPGQGGGIDQNIGTIELSLSAVNLDAVDVIGDESQFIQTVDKKIFNVGKNLMASGGTGSDVLRKVPSVDVNIDGVVSIAGDENVTILIDGKRSVMTGSGRRGNVDNIAASMVERVEVITNPSAKYDPDGVGGIINIVLKRGAFEGFNGTVSAMAGQRGKQNYSGNLNYRTDQWNIFSSSNFRTGTRAGDGLREFQYKYTDRTDSLFQKTHRESTPQNLSFRLGGDYYPSENSTIGYTFDIADHQDRTEQEFNYTTNSIDTSLLGIRKTTEYDDGLHLDHVLSYENKFNSDKQLLKAYASFSHEVDDVHEHGDSETKINSGTSDQSTDAVEQNESITLAFDYEDEFKDKIGLEIGTKATLRDFGTDLTYLDDVYYNDYSENIYAAYLVTKYEINNHFGLKIGARAEQAETKATLKRPGLPRGQDDSTNVITSIIDTAISDSPFEPSYTQIYPSLFLLYKLNERQSIQFGYSKKVNRPNRRTLSPFPRNTQDISRLRNGNPFLNPEYSDVMEINFSSNSRRLNLNTSLSYKNTEDVIMWWDRDYVVFDSTNYELMTAGNAEKSTSMNFNGNIMYRPIPLASVMIWGYGWNSEISDKGEADFNGNSSGIGLGGQLTLNIPMVARIELSMRGRGKMKITTGTIPANYTASLGVQRSFLQKRLSVTLKVNDLFDTGKFIIDTSNEITNAITQETYTQLMYAERQRDQRFMSVVLNYNFGKQQKKRWGKGNMSGRGQGGGGMDMDY